MRKYRILGIIPARGKSKSIPKKNIKSFLGKPLVAWAIETLKTSKVCDRIIVSTDDKEIAAVAEKYGAEIPFMRPSSLAKDSSPTLDVLQHALLWLRDNENYLPDYVVLLEPTSIGKRPQHIKGILRLIIKSGADCCFSVSEVPKTLNAYWQFKVDREGKVKLVTGGDIKDIIRRRQDLPKTYFRSGSVYIFKPKLLFEDKPSFYGEDVRAYITDAKYALDIDTPEDWELAEKRFKKILAKEQ